MHNVIFYDKNVKTSIWRKKIGYALHSMLKVVRSSRGVQGTEASRGW